MTPTQPLLFAGDDETPRARRAPRGPLPQVLQDIIDTAIVEATLAAASFHKHHSLQPRVGLLADLIREEVAAALPEALEDAWEAYDVGMLPTGAATFLAAVRLAGIRAAQRSRR